MANQQKVLVPDIGDFSGIEVIEILVAAGEQIEKDASLVTLESDKAAMEIPSPFAGIVQSIEITMGDKVNEGDLLVIMEVTEEAASPQVEAEPVATETAPVEDTPPEPEPVAEKAAEPQRLPGDKEPSPPPVTSRPEDKIRPSSHASPSVRRFARELGVDLAQVKGTGRKQRVTQEDVRSHVKHIVSAGTTPQSGSLIGLPQLPVVDFSAFGETSTQPLGRIKKLSGKHLQGCWLNIPHVTQFDEADITDLEDFRKQMKEEALRQDIRLTPMPFMMKACVAALKAMPDFNSSLSADGESLVIKHYYHLGIAVDTPKGLVVPVIRDVDQKSLYELASELGEISAKARKGRLSPDDMRGGTFTISSLGGIGGSGFTPIVNAPEVAILGLSRSKMQPVWNGKEFLPRLILPFSVSYDHRVIDGVQGVRFTTLLASLLGDIRRMML